MLPYLVPIAIFGFIDDQWKLAANSAPNVGMYSGGEIPGICVVLLIGLFLQLVAGIPVGIILANVKCRGIRACCALALLVVPFSTVRPLPSKSVLIIIGETPELLAEWTFIGLGIAVALFSIRPYNRAKTEQIANAKTPEAPKAPI